MCKKCEFYLVSIISKNLILKKQHLPQFVFFLHSLITYSVFTAPYTRTKLHKEKDFLFYSTVYPAAYSTGHIIFVHIFICWTLLNKPIYELELICLAVDFFLIKLILQHQQKHQKEEKISLRDSPLFFCHSCIFHTCTSIAESKCISTILYLSRCL